MRPPQQQQNYGVNSRREQSGSAAGDVRFDERGSAKPFTLSQSRTASRLCIARRLCTAGYSSYPYYYGSSGYCYPSYYGSYLQWPWLLRRRILRWVLRGVVAIYGGGSYGGRGSFGGSIGFWILELPRWWWASVDTDANADD